MTPIYAAARKPETTPMRFGAVDGSARVVGQPVVEVLSFARIDTPRAATPFDGPAANACADGPCACPRCVEAEEDDGIDNVVEISVQAYSDGHARGVEEGREAGQAEVRAVAETLRGVIQSLESQRQRFAEGLQDEVVELALMIAERVLHAEVSKDGAALAARLAQAGIARLGECQRLVVRMHPEDVVRAHATELGGGRAKVLADPALSRGDAVVEADVGHVDARLRAQLDEIRAALAAPELEGQR